MSKQIKNRAFLSALTLFLGTHSYTLGSDQTTDALLAFGKTLIQANEAYCLPPSSETNKIEDQKKQNARKPLVEVKGGYFFFSDSKLRKIYDQGGVDVQLSTSYPIWKWLKIYGSVEYMQIEGRTLGGHEKTRIWEVPLSLGLQPVAVICRAVQYYLTIGPRYFFVHQHNDSHFLTKNVGNNGLGGFINTGFYFFPYKSLVLDVFGEYSYKRMHFHAHKTRVFGETTQVGGFVFGLGLGYTY
jgi:hypothetical protein